MDGLIKMLDAAGRTITVLEQQVTQQAQRIAELEAQIAEKNEKKS